MLTRHQLNFADKLLSWVLQWARNGDGRYGSFRRDVTLPVAVKAEKIKATYRDGVLRIELPKADEARARRIAVNAA